MIDIKAYKQKREEIEFIEKHMGRIIVYNNIKDIASSKDFINYKEENSYDA